MNVKERNGDVILSGIDSFSLDEIFECGQCFRWEKVSSKSYIGVAKGRALKVSQNGREVIFHSTSREDFFDIWADYFDLDTDYAKIKAELSKDEVMKRAIGCGEGIRILRQDAWECVISFIISASNNIPRIKKIISAFCQAFGEKITYMGENYYTFPAPERIAGLSVEDLAPIKAGFRDKYILSAAKSFASGELDVKSLYNMPTESAKQELKKLAGVGNKVADCILLFGLSKTESFPIDVWIKRIMEYCYFDGPQSIDTISEFSKKRFCSLGGYAQQYLFFYARENKIGV